MLPMFQQLNPNNLEIGRVNFCKKTLTFVDLYCCRVDPRFCR